MTLLAALASLVVGAIVGLLVGRKHPDIASATAALAKKAQAEVQK